MLSCAFQSNHDESQAVRVILGLSGDAPVHVSFIFLAVALLGEILLVVDLVSSRLPFHHQSMSP